MTLADFESASSWAVEEYSRLRSSSVLVIHTVSAKGTKVAARNIRISLLRSRFTVLRPAYYPWADHRCLWSAGCDGRRRKPIVRPTEIDRILHSALHHLAMEIRQAQRACLQSPVRFIRSRFAGQPLDEAAQADTGVAHD
jgi:hypothetical protein